MYKDFVHKTDSSQGYALGKECDPLKLTKRECLHWRFQAAIFHSMFALAFSSCNFAFSYLHQIELSQYKLGTALVMNTWS